MVKPSSLENDSGSSSDGGFLFNDQFFQLLVVVGEWTIG
jgi:hypothetical protein